MYIPKVILTKIFTIAKIEAEIHILIRGSNAKNKYIREKSICVKNLFIIF